MKIVGCDFHPRWQQIAVFDTETGELSRSAKSTVQLRRIPLTRDLGATSAEISAPFERRLGSAYAV